MMAGYDAGEQCGVRQGMLTLVPVTLYIMGAGALFLGYTAVTSQNGTLVTSRFGETFPSRAFFPAHYAVGAMDLAVGMAACMMVETHFMTAPQPKFCAAYLVVTAATGTAALILYPWFLFVGVLACSIAGKAILSANSRITEQEARIVVEHATAGGLLAAVRE